MAKKILILLAVEEELGADHIAALSSSCSLRLMGVGKLRAYEATLKALHEQDYDVVINVGTCGSFRHPYATVLRPSVIVQGDVYIDSIFASKPITINTGYENVSIVSSDNFIGEDTPVAQRKLISSFDCMDMEAYAVVRAVKLHSVLNEKLMPQVHMLKIVSDGADGTIGDWSERVERLRPLLMEALCNLINEIADED